MPTLKPETPNTRVYHLTEAQRHAIADALDIAFDEFDTVVASGHDPSLITSLKEKFEFPILPQPLWRSPEFFTEEDQNNMAEMMIEEIGGSLKQYAHDDLDKIEDFVELVSYCDYDPEQTAAFLQAVVDSDGDELGYPPGYEKNWDFCKRMNLIGQGQQGDYLTEHGQRYLTEYK